MYQKIESRLVLGENVSQAAQFVESGNAQAGLVALSHALAPGMKDKGRYWEVPGNAYPELDQSAVIVSRSHLKKEAAAFLEFLHGTEPQSVLQKYGFSLPGEKSEEESSPKESSLKEEGSAQEGRGKEERLGEGQQERRQEGLMPMSFELSCHS